MNLQVQNRNMRRSIRRCFPLFVLPVLICFTFSFIVPFVQALYLSFCDFLIPKDAVWVGISNYRTAFLDVSFWHSFLITFFFAVASILTINIPAYFIAYLLKDKFRAVSLFRTAFFIPNLIGGIVLGYIWSMLFDGVFSYFGTYLTASPVYGFCGLVILVAWQQIGYMMIIYIAAFNAIPDEMTEAAEIDGAGAVQKMLHVITPNMIPSITVCTFLTLTNSFKMFDQNLALTGGAPIRTMESGMQLKTTELLALNIYSTYQINRNWHGTAQAKAVVFTLLVGGMAALQMLLTKERKPKKHAVTEDLKAETAVVTVKTENREGGAKA